MTTTSVTYPTPPREPSSPADSAVEATLITRRYRPTRKEPQRTALDGVSLTVLRGEWLTLLGPNGSGKSTLLRILATLDRPDEGRAAVCGIDPNHSRAALRSVRARIGVVFQRPSLDALLSVRENLLLQAALIGLTRSEAEERARSAARAMGIDDRYDSRVGTLSGGLARRADIARALLAEPELLLLDEPTTGLDLNSRRALLDTLDQRRRSSPKPLTLIFATHLMDEAERSDRVALIHQGRIAAQGRPDELRRALGGRVLVTEPSRTSTLESAGLVVKQCGPDAVGTGSPEAIEAAAVALTRAGASFTVGPPTLADVYLAHTGNRLTDLTESEPDSPPQEA